MITNFNEIEVLMNIQHMIDKNRCSVDGFFTDSRGAAMDILKYLESENIIIKNSRAVEIAFDERNRAA